MLLKYNMLLYRIKRKIHKLFHPPLGEILMLHRVMEERSVKPENRELEITPDFLEKTILKYKAAYYQLVTLDDIYRHLTGLQKINGKFVCFTFDDGFVDNYELAYPILKKYQCPFVVYITTGFVEATVPIWWYHEQFAGQKRLALLPEQIIELSNNPLCTIGAHTVSHSRLTHINAKSQRKELLESKHYLEKLTGKPVVHFAYPHGDYNDEVVNLVKECGYKTAVLVWGNYVRKGQSPLLLNRKILKQA
jgi:peptidoglycan/xylan/chitin deacetylase (PgdA/CDA1 family)